MRRQLSVLGRRNGSQWIRFAACVLALTSACIVEAQEILTEMRSVPMRVDRTDVSTGMVMEFSYEPVESSFADFNPGADPDRQAMNGLLEALVSGDVAAAQTFTAVVPGSSPDSNVELLQAFSGMLESTVDLLQLERIVHMGSDRLLLWSLPMEDGSRYYRSFRFVRDEADALRYEGVASEPLSSLLTYAFQTTQDQGPSEAEADDFDYSYTFPGTDLAPVQLRFDGTQIDVNAFDAQGETGIAAVDFYIEAVNALAGGSPEDFAEFYTPFSEGRYIDWAANEGTEAYEAYRSDMVTYGARVVFALDANPLHLIFYLPSDLAVTGAPLRYAAVYDHPETGMELTNFFVVGLADQILQRREYFEEPFLRPLLASTGVISSEPETEGVVVTAGETTPPDPDELLAQMESQTAVADELSVTNVEDLARERQLWPWIIAAIALLAIIVFALSRRNRNDSSS